MSRLCHVLKRRATTAPFFALSNVESLEVGWEAGVSPSVVDANKITFLKVSSNFFQPLVSFSSFSLLGPNLSLFLSSIDLARRWMPSNMEEVLLTGWGFVASLAGRAICLSCRSRHHLLIFLSIVELC